MVQLLDDAKYKKADFQAVLDTCTHLSSHKQSMLLAQNMSISLMELQVLGKPHQSPLKQRRELSHTIMIEQRDKHLME
jgi:hypothetical protein